MALLKAINYDPATLVIKSTSTWIAMTALDTTNLRITFTAPESGNVLVRLRGVIDGSGTNPRIMFGIMEGTTVRGRVAASGTGNWYTSGSSWMAVESTFTQYGLTPGTQYTWDAAYSVEYPNANSSLRYGGPNDTSQTPNTAGAFLFEVWEA